MDRTRLIFLLIVAAAVVVACGVVGFQMLTGLVSDNRGAETEVSSQAEASPIPHNSVLVTVASSNTKENWLNQVVAQFNAESNTTSDGNSIIVEVKHVTSGGSMNGTMAG